MKGNQGIQGRWDSIFSRKTSVPWWSQVAKGMKCWASESGQRHRRERTGSYLIPLCQAPFGAHGMCSSSVPMLSIFFYIYCTCEILDMRGMKFCNLFWKVGHCQSQESNSHPANNQTQVLPMTFSAEGPACTWKAREPMCPVSKNSLMYRLPVTSTWCKSNSHFLLITLL